MIVPATRRHVSSLDSLALGHEYSIDSGMGGSYDVRYEGCREQVFHFVRFYPRGADKGPPHVYEIPAADVTSRIFTNVPADLYFRKLDAVERVKLNVHAEHNKDCSACRREGYVFIEFTDADGEFATVMFYGNNPKLPLCISVRANTARPDHPRRRELPKTAAMIDSHLSRKLAWHQTDDLMEWRCDGKSTEAAYLAMYQMGFKAHGEEADWLLTGKWPE
jgi:hypothetical protein